MTSFWRSNDQGENETVADPIGPVIEVQNEIIVVSIIVVILVVYVACRRRVVVVVSVVSSSSSSLSLSSSVS
jgi:hypothetical protein